ncbi:hypothetical protein [Streptomyces sp. NBC_00829]|uniref:hypothetical protein n=1 Tax=Streptomyces sp. NBC_00829 TaxID=2903679 RepID=UPI002F912DB2|nr:hypothetical protein OG293_40360 [Streptomyces sp. NBC_00829]WTB19962.1 hypothetical protein OG293_41645 [Streptomyces sp. NBC_00829]
MTSASQPPRVSDKAEKALREAMERLFAGTPLRTDGKLTKNNLWREAGVSRATMNRATTLLNDWNSRISGSTASQRDQDQAQAIKELRRQLKTKTAEGRRLQDQVDASATVIAVLLAENDALRRQLATRSAVVVPLARSQATRE